MADNKNFINVRIDGEEAVPVAPEIGGMNAGAVNRWSNCTCST